ncbi:N-acetylglucosaminyl deacetylase, LmbE family [Jatrophihabitans endophyticus]|uniref:N-acetylglucosaminyl deacetylase, LmbE family n=1 Tax=Jatrophihabitans endophyticus TaxID=1206085 RepID=A0A1M5DXJ2_9ACTN|nr:bifunctional PIG-L family deacetylase/class I SAM-dependent methyltransferase [Jatrophihabitans endophyticus]SHF71665.1 N-acetylglucosaminyl deacetylase, LmbE family [Jatrophihabitans endophyticus]
MTFDHRDAGPPAAAWDSLVTGLAELRLPGSGDRLVVVAAHPDDETLGAGGLLAAAARHGCPATVVVLTDGEASHPDSPTHRPHQLAALRRREVYAAVAATAPDAEVQLAGLPDGRLAEHRDELTAVLEPLAATATHLVTPWDGDRHPDHEAVADVGRELAARHGCRHWQYPIWTWHWDDPAHSVLATYDLRRVSLHDTDRAAKRAALACHTSQHSPLSDEPGDEALLPPSLVGAAERDGEVFVVGPAQGTEPAATPVAYFEQLYAKAADPWGLDERFYEQRKRAGLLAALTRPRFRRAFEPGCATGALSAELARRCDDLVAWDAVDTATAATANRLRDAANVTVATGRIPEDWPDGEFDLIVLSEVGYYCADLGRLTERVLGSLAPDGVLVACHWRHAAAMHAHTAGEVHGALGVSLRAVVSHVEDDFLLHAWTRTGESVATATGIVR